MPFPLKPKITREILVALVSGDLSKIAELEKTHRFAIKDFRDSGYQLCDDSASCPNTPVTKILKDALQFEAEHNSKPTHPAMQQKLQDALGAKNALYFAPNADITAALCRKGVDINASSAQLSPLIWQAQCYHLSNFLELLVHGANTHTKYPLFADISTLEFVINQLNNLIKDTTLLPNTLSEDQKTMFDMARALMVATNHPFEQKPHSITTIEKYLVSNIENPAIREHLLTLAAAKQRIPADLQEELTVYTPSLQAAIAEKNTPLHIFAAEGRKDLLRVVIKRGGLFVDVNAKNAAGETPLLVALKKNQVDTALYLLKEHGASLPKQAKEYVEKYCTVSNVDGSTDMNQASGIFSSLHKERAAYKALHPSITSQTKEFFTEVGKAAEQITSFGSKAYKRFTNSPEDVTSLLNSKDEPNEPPSEVQQQLYPVLSPPPYPALPPSFQFDPTLHPFSGPYTLTSENSLVPAHWNPNKKLYEPISTYTLPPLMPAVYPTSAEVPPGPHSFAGKVSQSKPPDHLWTQYVDMPQGYAPDPSAQTWKDMLSTPPKTNATIKS